MLVNKYLYSPEANNILTIRTSKLSGQSFTFFRDATFLRVLSDKSICKVCYCMFKDTKAAVSLQCCPLQRITKKSPC